MAAGQAAVKQPPLPLAQGSPGLKAAAKATLPAVPDPAGKRPVLVGTQSPGSCCLSAPPTGQAGQVWAHVPATLASDE